LYDDPDEYYQYFNRRGKCFACASGYNYIYWADPDDPDLDYDRQNTCEKIVCGEVGFVPGEGECDDGNSDPEDGCDECQILENYSCDEATKSICDLCGNQKRSGGELCDDGDSEDGVGCKADCSGPLDGWSCSEGSDS